MGGEMRMEVEKKITRSFDDIESGWKLRMGIIDYGYLIFIFIFILSKVKSYVLSLLLVNLDRQTIKSIRINILLKSDHFLKLRRDSIWHEM